MDHSNESFADLFGQHEETKLRHFTPGEQITATIIDINGDHVFLDVGGKSEGVLDASELKNDLGEITAQPGDQLKVYFLRSGGAELRFTRRLGSGSGAAHLEDAWQSGIPVEGFVKAEIKGGFEITLGGNVRAFCPASQMSLRRIDDLAAAFLETRMMFRITRFESNGRNIVVSARVLQEEEREQQKEQLKKTLQEGDTVAGVVSSLRDFGAFVDLGGVDGLIPISEVSWTRVDDIEQYFRVGETVQVVVNTIDWDKERISLSYKKTQEDPWEKAVTTFNEGSVHQGTVSHLAQFGAFVTLAPGVDGLIHISKLGAGDGRRINHPSQVVEPGQIIEVIVESVQIAERRISLVPSDYVSPQQEEDKERQEYKTYMTRKKPAADKELGSLGELLKKKMAERQG